MKSMERTFLPGSRWVYFKIYIGTKTADKLLTTDIPFILQQLKKNRLIEKWFFIRYSDPDFHIRVRIFAKEESYISEIISYFHKKLFFALKNNIIWKVQLDTYKREIERYNTYLIEETETYFYLDSECIIAILKKLYTSKNDEYRWMISLLLIDQLLTDFSFDLNEKLSLMKDLSNSFKLEFGFNEHNSKQLNSKFRDNRKTITDVIERKINYNDFTELYRPIQKRSKELKQTVQIINEKTKANQISINNLLSSYIHMSLNRLFRAKNRIHELVIYDFMKRYYESKIAQNKYLKQ